jgi:D-xylonolactonase
MDIDPELVVDTRCHTGEGPLYHPDEDAVYWVDIPNAQLFRYFPDKDDYEVVFNEHTAVGGYTIEQDGALELFRARGLVERYRDGDRDTLVAEIDRERASRFNDVIADPEGRVFAGTMPTSDGGGTLYRFDPDGTYTPVRTDVALPNGMGFTPAGDSLYFTESDAGLIHEFDYDRSTGEISNRTVFVDVSDEEGIPDGLTVDEEGYVWSARWDGGCLVRYSPKGEEVDRVMFPAKKVSCATFGGRDYSTMYVTTAGGYDRETEGEAAGALFAFDAPVSGQPEFRSALGPAQDDRTNN